ncbi:MAG: hypothetical protein NVS3B1_06430 [Marmoricola sp.]
MSGMPLEDDTCSECGKPYTDKPCGLNHMTIKDKLTERYDDKTWPPTSLETK